MSQRAGVVNMHEVPEEAWEEGKFGGREQDLGRAAGSAKVGLRREVIPPGKQSSPRHARMSEEEIFVVLRGRGTLLRGEERVAVEAGDVTAFPAGTGVAHAFVADLGEELEFLSIGERNDNDVVLYLDLGKMLVDESRVHRQILLTPLLIPLRAQHTNTTGNHQQRNRLR